MAFTDCTSVMSDSSRLALFIITCPVIFILYDVYRKHLLLPGPRSLPLLGNILSIRGSTPYKLFTLWSKLHGGIYAVYTGLTARIVISDPQVAWDLLSVRSNKWSSRPRLIVFDEYFARGATIITYPYGPAWSLRRRIFHQYLKPSALNTYKERQEAEASKLIFQIARDEGAKWREAIERYTSSVVFTLSYGRRIDTLDSTTHQKRLAFIYYSGKLNQPGAYLVESLPFLRYLPDWLAKWRAPIQEMGDKLAAFDNSLVENVKSDLANSGGKGVGSITENMLIAAAKGDAEIQSLMLTPHHFSGIPSTLFGAGSSTTIASLSATVLALILHPHVFLAAQREIDSVVGSSRSPCFEDRENLPYIDAIVKETLRWRPAVPIGLAHATSESDTYNGYTIPAKTPVHYNTWGMHHDISYFPSPDEFAPERYLDEKDVRYRPELRGEKVFPGKYGHSGFGWGRRICAGADLAVNGMWIPIAKLIWAFDLEKIAGFDYDQVVFEGDLIFEVANFACRWKVRDDEHREVLDREMRGADEILDRFKALE